MEFSGSPQRRPADRSPAPWPIEASAAAQTWIDVGRRLDRRGILAGREGNFSQRLGDGNILVTARGAWKGRLGAQDFALLDPRGQRISGAEPSSEYRLHLAVYAAHDAAQAIVHAHPAWATALAAASLPLPADFLPELLTELGTIPLVPYATPGTEELAHAVEWHYRQGAAALLERHGAVCWGADAWQACARMEVLERAAQAYLLGALLKGHAPSGLTVEQARAVMHAAERL